MTDFNWSWYSEGIAEIFVMFVCLVLLIAGAFSHKSVEGKFVRNLTFLGLLGALVMVMVIGHIPEVRQFAFPVVESQTDVVGALGGLYVNDRFTVFLKVFVIISAMLSLLLVDDYMTRKKTRKYEYDILILLSVLGAMIMISAADLMMMYIGLELMSFSLYILTSFHRKDAKSSEAGLKYFILGSLASGLLLFGMSYIYGLTGSTSFDGIQQAFAAGKGISDAPMMTSFALVMMLTGMAFKMSAAPFHMWTPDVYEGAPTPVTAYMSIVPKIAALGIFIRVLFEPLMYLADQWQQVIIALCIMSMFVGSFMAIVQNNLKRLLAYSSIANIGFMLIPVSTASIYAVDEAMSYLLVYSMMTLGIFAVLLSLRMRERFVENIDDLKGLAKSSPTSAAALAILMFSLAGVPPFAGFMVKLEAFRVGVEMGLTWLVTMAVVLSVVSAYYCLRIVKVMYFDEGKDIYSPEVPNEIRLVAWFMVVLVIGFGILPDTIFNITSTIPQALLNATAFYG
jgi:NADH-quinone oxidoreductase subunit N